jgi:hypothetical protein
MVNLFPLFVDIKRRRHSIHRSWSVHHVQRWGRSGPRPTRGDVFIAVDVWYRYFGRHRAEWSAAAGH